MPFFFFMYRHYCWLRHLFNTMFIWHLYERFCYFKDRKLLGNEQTKYKDTCQTFFKIYQGIFHHILFKIVTFKQITKLLMNECSICSYKKRQRIRQMPRRKVFLLLLQWIEYFRRTSQEAQIIRLVIEMCLAFWFISVITFKNNVVDSNMNKVT